LVVNEKGGGEKKIAKSDYQCFRQILRPFTLAFTVSQADGHGMRINVNIGDLCLNVSPKSIEIMQNSIQVLIWCFDISAGKVLR
jgi:hypothetical protein